MHTPKETHNEIKTKRYTFSPASGTDVKKYCCFFNVELQIRFRYQQFQIFLSFMETFFKSN